MPVRRRLVDRTEDGRTLYAISGDELPWKFNVQRDAWWVVSKDQRAKYVVYRPKPEGWDRGGLPFPYWKAVVLLGGKEIDLGDRHMIAWEGKEVCQIYDSARLDPKQLPEARKRLEQNTRGKNKGQH